MTQAALALCIEECADPRFQSLIMEDTVEALWAADCEIPLLVFERDELEYFSSGFGMADVLDIAWSACCNGLN